MHTSESGQAVGLDTYIVVERAEHTYVGEYLWQPVPATLHASPSHNAKHSDLILGGGTIIDGVKTTKKSKGRWVEVGSDLWLYVGGNKTKRAGDAVKVGEGKYGPMLAMLLAKLPLLDGYGYSRTVCFPPDTNVHPSLTNGISGLGMDCSSLTWLCLDWLYGRGHTNWYKQHQLIQTPNPFAAIAAAEANGVASETGTDMPAGSGIFLMQSWHDSAAWKGGHQWLQIQLPDGERGDLLERAGVDSTCISLEASNNPRHRGQCPSWSDTRPEWRGREVMWAKLKPVDLYGIAQDV
jgi:hypothetical protein|tara:strand:+ start:1389 stop:2270 length:882 start_codon:yes stop_codon:yes gene_type:complete